MLKKIALLSALALSLSACSMKTTHFVNQNNGQSLADTSPVTDNSDYFVGGLWQSENINAQAACGTSDKVVAVQTHRTFENFLLGAFTLGIYTPQEQTVFCKK